MAQDTATRTLISSAQLRRGRGRIVYWTLLTVVVVGFTLVFVGPLYWMVTGALKSGQEIAQTPPSLFPRDPQPQNYVDAWRHLDLAKLLFNTFYYAAGALVFQLVLDTAAAYALSKLRPVLGNLILGLMLATLMIPAMVLVVPQYVTVIDLPILHVSLLDSPFAIWLPAVANAFNIFLLKRFFDSIPEELMAAALVDGASPLRTLWSIILPMSRPILGVVSIFAVTAVWKDFLWPKLVMPSPETRTISVGIYAFSGGTPMNVVIAASVIAAIPTVLIFLIFQRNIMSGLTTGSLKG
ncbi:carbohydrate ABC transporter permease [Micromonospora carbonacea]|uniref:Carbohydrate ABC transporter membrane protein 2, CUT1 family n=1 Tax=Micromonospora carbonacea TaxID=47853 RepID=A0A1C4WVX3_9ACTN|nr:carbohydrate ABC transporter permease [Micromonospora carbonacea]MBB5825567.1 multiple sugar transport system permease protein [Micromonospora carbonacea]QLD26399.1 carbohydrate ABC transporter permease [Micromonospora carbonacea]SCF00328.1 carbohydrate ABC transporter membrane protein 2, CUT1 family [Micromonospora carbonacea]